LIAEALKSIVDALRLWGERKNENAREIVRKREAIQLVMEAVLATKAYQYELSKGRDPSRTQERDLSNKWQRAAMAISEYDYALYQSAQLKAIGWADPREWKRASDRPDAIKLDVIIEQCEWVQSKIKSTKS
jgi:hypothetical protein